MDRAAVTKILRRDVWPTVRALGFKNSQRLTAWRYDSRRVDLIQVHFVHKHTAERYEWLDCSYTLGWGLYLTDVPEGRPPRIDAKLRLHPRLDEAHLARIARHLESDSTVLAETFAITSDPSIAECVSKTIEIIETQTVEWFECHSTISAVISALARNDSEQWSIDPYTYGPGSAKSYRRKVVLAHLLLSENRFDEVAQEIDCAYSEITGSPNLDLNDKNQKIDELKALERRLHFARKRSGSG